MSKTINQENLNSSLRFLDKMAAVGVEQLKSTDPARAQQLETLNALLSREDFCQQLIACTNTQEATKLFADNGLALTEDEVGLLASQINVLVKKLTLNNGSLSEEDLELIAGGSLRSWLIGLGSAWGGGHVGAAIGAGIGSVVPGLGTLIGAIVGCGVGALACGLGVGLNVD